MDLSPGSDHILQAEIGVDHSTGPPFDSHPRRTSITVTAHAFSNLERALVLFDEKSSIEPIYVDFVDGDPRDPKQFSHRRKWIITITACFFTILAGTNGVSFALGYGSMMRDLNCTQFQATLGLSVYCLGFCVVPLFSTSFSEEFGRQPLYLISSLGFSLMHVMTALSKNVQTVIVARFVSGAFGSTGATVVGGTIADIWGAHERGLPMSLLSVTALGSPGLGAMAAGWIEQNPHLQWKWIQWVSLILAAALTVAIQIFMQETRSSILLVRMAKKLRKQTGDQRYRARVEDQSRSIWKLVYISITRPIELVFTEPTVASFSLWIGFAWGVLYAIVETMEPVFSELHNFNPGQVGSVFITVTIGSLLGYFTNIYQERLYGKKVLTRGPEARLIVVCFATFLIPIGMIIYAWTAFSFVHWIAPAIGVTLFMWGLFSIYCAVFNYLADVYGPYASSAMAGQSLSRNIMGTVFPLFVPQMMNKLGYNWGNTLLALGALALVPIPTVLFFYGPRIRARSKFASKITHKPL